MLTFIVLMLIVGLLIYIGYAIGDVKTHNRYFDERIEVLKERDWWVDKFNDCSDELKKATDKNNILNQKLKEYDKEIERITYQLEQYILRFGELKETIEMEHKEEIIEYYNEGLSYKKIAEKIGCGASTVQRAVKKRGLVRQK